jgi:hypothetical protein
VGVGLFGDLAGSPRQPHLHFLGEDVERYAEEEEKVNGEGHWHEAK